MGTILLGSGDSAVISEGWVEQGLRLAPICVAVRDHDVETPVAPLFLGFHQAERAEIEEVILDETYLLFAQAAPLQVNGDSGEMR